jgi:hypothetical protein
MAVTHLRMGKRFRNWVIRNYPNFKVEVPGMKSIKRKKKVRNFFKISFSYSVLCPIELELV